jgi:thiamine pyrophosphokinase
MNESLIQQLIGPAKREQRALVISGSPQGVTPALVSLLARQVNFVVAVDSGAEVVRAAADVEMARSAGAEIARSKDTLVASPTDAKPPLTDAKPPPTDAELLPKGFMLASELDTDIELDLVLGDFDSIDPWTLMYLRSKGVAIVSYDSHKDATDLELALNMVWQRGFMTAVATNVLGGRLDHELAALGNLAMMAERGMAVSIVEESECCVFLSAHGEQGEGNVCDSRGSRSACGVLASRGVLSSRNALRLDFSSTPAPSFISLISWGGAATVSIKGVKWELDQVTLASFSSRGVSNVVVGQQVDITVHEGTIVALLET